MLEVDRPAHHYCPRPEALWRGRTVWWKGIILELHDAPDHPICFFPEEGKEGELRFGSLWIGYRGEDGWGRLSPRNTLWLSKNEHPGEFIVVADGLPGDSVTIGDLTVPFGTCWRDCVLVRETRRKKDRVVEKVVVATHWNPEEVLSGGLYEKQAPMHFHVSLVLVGQHTWHWYPQPPIRNAYRRDLRVLAHQKSYTFSVHPEEPSRRALVVE